MILAGARSWPLPASVALPGLPCCAKFLSVVEPFFLPIPPLFHPADTGLQWRLEVFFFGLFDFLIQFPFFSRELSGQAWSP